MFFVLIMFPLFLDAGCTPSKPVRNSAQNIQTTYVRPISPIHVSVARCRQSSSSVVSEEGEAMSLKQAITRIERHYRGDDEKKQIEPNVQQHQRIKRKKSEPIQWDLD